MKEAQKHSCRDTYPQSRIDAHHEDAFYFACSVTPQHNSREENVQNVFSMPNSDFAMNISQTFEYLSR
jgi:hypothetical protein